MESYGEKRKFKFLNRRVITKVDVIALLFIVIGCIMIIYGNEKIQRYKNLKKLEELTIDQIQENTYVKGNVNSTLCCYASIDLYDYYVVPIGMKEKSRQYITVLADTTHSVALGNLPTTDYVWKEIGMTTKTETANEMEIFGIIKKLPEDSFNYDYLKEQFSTEDTKLIDTYVSSAYCIEFVKEESIKYWYKCGMTLLFCGIAIYLFFVVPKLYKKSVVKEEDIARNPVERKKNKQKVNNFIKHFLENAAGEVSSIILADSEKILELTDENEINVIINCFLKATYDKVYEEVNAEIRYTIEMILENGESIEISICTEKIIFWYGNWYLMDSVSYNKIHKIFHKNGM